MRERDLFEACRTYPVQCCTADCTEGWDNSENCCTSVCGPHTLAGLQGVCVCYLQPHTGSEQLYGEIENGWLPTLSMVVLATKWEWKETQTVAWGCYSRFLVRPGSLHLSWEVAAPGWKCDWAAASLPWLCAPQVICPWSLLDWNREAGEAAPHLFPDGVSGVSVWLAIHATYRKDTQAHECWMSSDSLLPVGLCLEQLHKGGLQDWIVWIVSKSD